MSLVDFVIPSQVKIGLAIVALVALLGIGWRIYSKIDEGGYKRKEGEIVLEDNKALKQDVVIRKKQNEIINADITPSAFGNILLKHRY